MSKPLLSTSLLLAGLLAGCGGAADDTPLAEAMADPGAAGDAGAAAPFAAPMPMPTSAGPGAWPRQAGPDPGGATAMTVANPAAPAPGRAPGTQRVAIIDPNGFGEPMASFWVELPAGWQTQGGMLWDPQAPCGATPSLRWQARSPDGQQVLTVHPSDAWTWDNLGLPVAQGQGACPRQQVTSARQYLEQWVRKHRPGARVLDTRDRPDLVIHPAPPSDQTVRWHKEAAETLLAYAENGQDRRESVSVVVLFSTMRMPGVMPGEVREFMSGVAIGATTLSAPAGALDLQLPGRFAASVQPDPKWQARMDQHNAQMARTAARGAADRSRIIADTSRDIADIQMRGWQERNAASDRMHARTIDAITDTTRYQDPAAGGQVRLDSHYDNTWRANDGTYLQTNDPNFDPYRDLGVDAERLEQIE